MRHSTKRGLLTVLAVLLCAMTALGIPALADAGTWTGLSPAEEPAEAYISLPGNSYSTFTQGFALAESQPVSITVAPNTATGSDARAELFFLNSGVAPTFINGSSAARGISVAFCGGSTATAFQPVAAGFGDGTWSTKPMYVSGAQPWIRVGEKAEIGLAKLDGEYWLTLNGEKVTTTVGEEQVNILSAIGGDFVSWIADGAEVFAATGRYNNSLSVYDLTGNGRLYTAQDLYDLPRTGSGSYTANNFYTDYLVFDSPLGVNIPLDASKEITVTLQAEPGWVNFAFLTECSNGGFAANNSRGTGFSLMTQDYGGLVLDIMNMNNGIQTPKVTSYFSSGAPADSHGQPNADGVTVGARDPFRFTIKPVEGGFEFWLQGKKMTAYGTDGASFYDSVKDSIGTFVNEQGFTYLNVTKSGDTEGRIYSIVNGDTVYTADQIAAAMTAAPRQLVSQSARTAAGEGSYSAGLPVLDFGFDFSAEALNGTKTLTFSDGESAGQTLTLSYNADGHLTGAVGEGTAVAAGTAAEPVSAGEYVRLRTQLANGHLYLTLNGTRVGELDPLAIADENGLTYLSFGGSDAEAALSFYTLYEQAAHALKTTVTVPGVTGAAVELLDENEEVIDSVCFTSGNTYALYAAAGAAPAKIRVSAEGFTTAVVDFAAETSVVLETPTYTGTVSLTANGEAVTGAVITLIKGEETVVMTEGESGVYTAENLTGIWTVTVQKAGYTFPT